MPEEKEQELPDPLEDKELVESTTKLAMAMLVAMYSEIPEEDLDEMPVTFWAGAVSDVLELFLAYVDKYEDLDIDGIMDSADIDQQANTITDTQSVH